MLTCEQIKLQQTHSISRAWDSGWQKQMPFITELQQAAQQRVPINHWLSFSAHLHGTD